jgi:hypothetical protein
MRIHYFMVGVFFLCSSLSEASTLSINEFMSSNNSVLADGDGDYSDWIELHNSGDTSIDLAGYGLTDSADTPMRWMFPALSIPSDGYIVVFASGKDKAVGAEFHTNFKLKASGETLFLNDPGGALVDSVSAGAIPSNVSFGRVPANPGAWLFYDHSTPGAVNSSKGYRAVVEPVHMSQKGGYYGSGITVTLSCATAGATIRYTLNGFDPDSTSTVYTGPLVIDSTRVLKAKAFADDALPGPVMVHSYFIDTHHSLPIISISSQNIDYIYNTYIGYELNDEVPEKPVNVEFYEPDGKLGFSLVAGLRLQGMSLGAGTDPKSFVIMARAIYGDNKIKYKVFPDLPITSYSSLILRNPKCNFIFRDALAYILTRDIDIDNQAYRPAVLYLNGAYWGTIEIREKQNEDYLASHHDIDPKNVDILENYFNQRNYPIVVEGNRVHYDALVNFVKNNDIQDDAKYSYVGTQMDIGEFMRYFVCETYFGNTDWTFQNVKFWRQKTTEGKWRWMLYDLDIGFWDYNINILSSLISSTGSTNIPPWTTVILRGLLKNDKFRNAFINLFSDYSATIFAPDFILKKIHEIQTVMEPEMPAHIQFWAEQMAKKENAEQSIPVENLKTMDDWYRNIGYLEEFVTKRWGVLNNHICTSFSLSGTAEMTLAVTPIGAGRIKLNTLTVSEFPVTQNRFKDVPIPIVAEPNVGYRFVRWEGIDGASDSIEVTMAGNQTLNAVFESNGDDIVIDSSQSPYLIASDLIVPAGKKLTIQAGVDVMIAQDANIVVNGELHIEGAEGNPVTFRNADGASRWGAICIDHASGACSLSHALISGASTGRDSTLYKAAVSSRMSNITVDHVTFENNVRSVYTFGGAAAVTDCLFEDSNASEAINLSTNETPVRVENCRIIATHDQDGVDFDTVTGGIIRNVEILSSADDGIDIGDRCSNILITGNRVFNCHDKCISIGEVSRDIRVEKNVLVGSYYGIAVKDSSIASIDHTTIYGCEYALATYEKGIDAYGGGTASVTNSILAGSRSAALDIDELSTITVAYSLSDTDVLPGTGNQQMNPLFVSAATGIFDLQSSSPCIDTGDPSSSHDLDGTRTDMGAVAYLPLSAKIVITEINYNSSADFDPGDWVELYNGGNEILDLTGFSFRDSDDTHVFAFPAGLLMKSGEYLVLCEDRAKFGALFPYVGNTAGDFGFGLNKGGEILRLFNSGGGLTDFVDFSDTNPWPMEPDGNGPTLSLKNPELDNSLPGNWSFSTGHGTPGGDNGTTKVESSAPVSFSLYQNYPNPFNSSTAIEFAIPMEGHVVLSVYDITGRKVRELVSGPLPAGLHTFLWNGLDSSGRTVSSGVYISRLVWNGEKGANRMLLMK